MGIFLKTVIACFIAFMPQLLKADVKLVDWLLFSDKAYANF
jgi:hypothetical protein